MADDGLDYDCICTRLVSLGVVHAVAQSGNGDAILDAISACMAEAPCRHHPHGSDGGPLGGVLHPRQDDDRRIAGDRRIADVPREPERRMSDERRVNPDRREGRTGQGYTPDEMHAALKSWCESHCAGGFKLWFDDGPKRALKFHFDLPSDQANFMAMLKDFRRPR